MTLRQEYARARHPDQPGRAVAAAHTGPVQISPLLQPGLGALLPQQPRPATGRLCPPPREACNPARSRGAATGWTLAAWRLQSGHSIKFPAARAHRGKPPLQPAPGTADACHRRPAPRLAPLQPYLAGCCRR
jgi:hypothetical protein